MSTTHEFLIRRVDAGGDWFDLQFAELPTVLRPVCCESDVIAGSGELRLRIGTAEVEINVEDPGIHVVVYGPIEVGLARQVVSELAESIQRHTGQSARVVVL